MIRALLSLLCGGLAVALGLGTSVLQSRNHETGAELDGLKRECERLSAECSALEARLLAVDFAFREGLQEEREGTGVPEH